jgi:hypothetical protein
MTEFLPSHLPTGTRKITTYEELIVWAAENLLAVNPTAKRVLVAGQAGVNCVQSDTGVDADSVRLHSVFAAIPLDLTTIGSSLPMWKRVKEIATTAAPTSFQG